MTLGYFSGIIDIEEFKEENIVELYLGKFYIINGYGGSGKDEFVSSISPYLTREHLSVVNLSTIDPIKTAAISLGWTGEKDNQSRKFLSDLKDLATKTYDTSYRYVLHMIQYVNSSNAVYFIHCREPEEIDRLVNTLGARTIYIDASKRVPKVISNHADKNVENYHYNYYIDNNGTIEELEAKAKDFAKLIIGRMNNGTVEGTTESGIH